MNSKKQYAGQQQLSQLAKMVGGGPVPSINVIRAEVMGRVAFPENKPKEELPPWQACLTLMVKALALVARRPRACNTRSRLVARRLLGCSDLRGTLVQLLKRCRPISLVIAHEDGRLGDLQVVSVQCITVISGQYITRGGWACWMPTGGSSARS